MFRSGIHSFGVGAFKSVLLQIRIPGKVLLQPIINMRKSFLYILCFVVACQLIGCGGGEEQRRQLAELEEQNHSGQPMQNDSLAEALVAYFDCHGNANERMRAKYILGRTYYCLGELPRALETYFEAADCADTTASDCDFAKLSRIHAQSAIIFNLQVQPRSQLNELRLAEYYAWKGLDTLQAIECYAQQGDAYDFLNQHDSVLIIRNKASELFRAIGQIDRSAQVLGSAISSSIEIGNKAQAKLYLDLYEKYSGLFDNNGDIEKGREIHYYIKGEYYLAIHQLDSAEYMFRKELRDGKDINNQIAGSKGLQKVYEQRRIPDSIAKYATLSYELNDSSYLLSEMQNIQKLQASYNYNHHKRLAEQSNRDAEHSRIIFISLIAFLLLSGGVTFAFYRSKKQKKLAEYRQNIESLSKIQSELQELCGEDSNVPALIARKNHEINYLQSQISEFQKRQTEKDRANLENRLVQSTIVQHLNDLLKENPVCSASRDEILQITNLINEQIPSFYHTLNTPKVLRPVEYEVCMLIRCHFKPSAIGKLLNLDDAYISNLRRRILHKIFGIEGNPKDLDERIMAII